MEGGKGVVGSAWSALPGLGPSTQPDVSFVGAGGENEWREGGSPLHLSTESRHPFQNNLNLLRDLAVHIAHSLRNSPDWGGVVALHR